MLFGQPLSFDFSYFNENITIPTFSTDAQHIESEKSSMIHAEFDESGRVSNASASTVSHNSNSDNNASQPRAENSSKPDLVDDEDILKLINDAEDGFSLLLLRVKESIQSTKEAYSFLKMRSKIEEDSAKAFIKLSHFVKSEGKQGMYSNAWQESLGIHKKLGEAKLSFSILLNEIAENISILTRNTERSRKQLKDAGSNCQKEMQYSDVSLDKARSRYESAIEDIVKSQQSDNSNKKMMNFIKVVIFITKKLVAR